MELVKKTLKQLKSINDRNLLLYFKAERRRFYVSFQQCDCCGMFSWEINPNDDYAQKAKMFHNEWREYLDFVISELHTRKSVEKSDVKIIELRHKESRKAESFHKRAHHMIVK